MINIKKIEKAVVKISSVFFSTLLSFLTVVWIIFFILSIGIDIDNTFKNSSIELNHLQLKFDRGVVIKIDGLHIKTTAESESSSSSELDIDLIRDALYSFKDLFRIVSIKNLTVDNYRIDIDYRDSTLKVKSRDGYLQSEIYIDENYNLTLSPKIEVLISEYRSKLKGIINYNLKSGLLHTKLHLNFKESIDIELFATGSKDRVKTYLRSREFKSLKPIFDTLKLGKPAYEWGVKRLENGYFRVIAETEFPTSSPLKALDYLKTDLTIRDLKYRFNPDLQVAEAEKLIAKIRDGDLNISFKGLQYRDISIRERDLKVKIESLFTKQTLYVDLKNQPIKFNQTIKETIKAYGVSDIPIQHNSGTLSTDFSLKLPFQNGKLQLLAEVEPQAVKLSSSGESFILDSGKVLYDGNLAINGVKVEYKELVTAKVNTDLNLSNMVIDSDIELQKLELNSSLGVKKPINIDINGEVNGTLKLNISKGKWNILGKDLNSSKFRVALFSDEVKLRGLNLDYEDYNLSLGLNSCFNFNKSIGKLHLNIDQADYPPVSISNKKLTALFKLRPNYSFITVPELKSSFKVGNKIDIQLIDLSRYLNFVELDIEPIKALKGGDLNVTIVDENISFNGNLTVNQKILKRKDSDFFNRIPVSGEVSGENIELKIDESLLVKRGEDIKIVSDGYDYNISGVTELLGENNSSDESGDKNSSLNIPLNIELFGKDTRVLIGSGMSFESDKLLLEAGGNSAYLQTSYDKGVIELKAVDDRFILKGTGIGDEFIHKISGFHGFRGGTYNIYAKGTENNITGILQFSKFTMKNFSLYNNLLAFLNTIPSLLTFSQPGFNEDGFRIKAGFILFQKLGSRIYLKDIQIHGKIASVTGLGYVDLESKKIRIQLNISTIQSIDKLISNIPIANYLILGKDGSLTTSVRVIGTFDDVKIRADIHKDIISTPMEIAKRVLHLPARILEVIKNYYDSNRVDEVNRIKEFFK